MRQLNVLLIAQNDPTLSWIQNSLQERGYKLIGPIDSVYYAMQKIQDNRVDIILADSSGQGVLETEWIQRLAVQSMEAVVIVTASTSEMEFVRQAMLAGAQGFLLKPFDLSELHKSIQQAHQLSLQRKALRSEALPTPETTTTDSNKARSIAVYSPKGGTGVTTLAVNLAIALNRQTDSPVLLVDADLHTADVDIFLNVLGRHSVYDLLDFGQKFDKETLGRVATKHPSGISVIRGESQLQIDIPIESGQMNDLVEQLSSVWDGYIVVNTSDGLDRWTAEILDAVDTVLLVTTPELPALRATRNLLDLAEAATDKSGKWQLIMTSYQGKKVLHTADIEASINFPIKATVAEDIALVSTSINRGTPFMVSNQKSLVARDVLSLAKELADTDPRHPKSQSVESEQSGTEKVANNQSKQAGQRSSIWNSIANSVRQTAG